MTAYLLVLGERTGLAWVLKHERMAFTADRARLGSRLKPGDELFIYTSRGCFGNPTRDRGRVVGAARVLTEMRERRQPVFLAGRDFTHEVKIQLESLVPFRQDGLELGGLVEQLETFSNKRAWAATLRRPLVSLSTRDSSLLRRRLRPVAGKPTEEVRERYIDATLRASERANRR